MTNRTGPLLFVIVTYFTAMLSWDVAHAASYSTGFPLTEDPISESGNWINGEAVGLDWNNVQTIPGRAFGAALVGGYDDDIAVLNATFASDQYAQGTVYRAAGYAPTEKHEIELLLRFKISAHEARGYEVLWGGGGGANGELAIVRWNGPAGNYTSLAGTAIAPAVDGDVLRAEIIGSVIKVYRNGSLVLTGPSDSTWIDGQPGMGFWPTDRGGGVTPASYGWRTFTASSVTATNERCVTANCALGATPGGCRNRAAPRTLQVHMTAALVFDPKTPVIEPDECIQWIADVIDIAHSATKSPGCSTETACSVSSPDSCGWETGNVSTGNSTCFYDSWTFPPSTSDQFGCRFHPGSDATGTLSISTGIGVTVDKDKARGHVLVAWTGGSGEYKVVRSGNGDPTFASANTATLNPDAGFPGLKFTDAGELGNAASRYYLIRNLQANDPP